MELAVALRQLERGRLARRGAAHPRRADLHARRLGSHLETYRGATFNLSQTLRQMLHLRPRDEYDEIDGLYLVGGSTHPGSGLPVIFESARVTTKLLLHKLDRRAVRN